MKSSAGMVGWFCDWWTLNLCLWALRRGTSCCFLSYMENCELLWRNPLLHSPPPGAVIVELKKINKRLAEGGANLFFSETFRAPSREAAAAYTSNFKEEPALTPCRFPFKVRVAVQGILLTWQTLLRQLIFSLNFLCLCRYFPAVRAPKSTVQVHVSGDWVTSPAFKRILFCEAREMDHGANLFWHCHAGGSAVHSGKANRGGKTDRFVYPTLIVRGKKKTQKKAASPPSGVHGYNCS